MARFHDDQLSRARWTSAMGIRKDIRNTFARLSRSCSKYPSPPSQPSVVVNVQDGKATTPLKPSPRRSVEVDDVEEDQTSYLLGIPFLFTGTVQRTELPEDIERVIFEMAASADIKEAVNTLVFINHRIRKWVEYIIYECVILQDAKHARLFLCGLENKHPDFAFGAVKFMALPSRISFDTSLGILTLCRNIRHLSWLPTNVLSTEVLDLISGLPLRSLRARMFSFFGPDPDFSNPLFERVTTLFVADHQRIWENWKWNGLRSRPNLKWIAVILDGRLNKLEGWVPVRVLEKRLLKPYGGPGAVELCLCYHYNPQLTGGRWIHRTEKTFSEERMAVISLDNRIDDRQWVRRINGECRDFEISEGLVKERLTKKES